LQGTWNYANTLSSNLIQANEVQKAKEVLQKSMNQLPLTNSSISDTLGKISLVQNLYFLKDNKNADQITANTSKYIAQEFEYILSLKPEVQQTFINDIRRGLYVLQNLDQLTEMHNQIGLSKSLKKQLKNYETRFTNSLS